MRTQKEDRNFQHGIITGGSSGIGKATAILLAQAGVNISLIARDRAKLELAQREIQAQTINSEQKVKIFTADVAQAESVEQAINTAIATNGIPDLLITSAGIAIPGYFEQIPIATFEQTMQVNYFGSLYAVRAVLPQMVAAGKGQLVLISSGAGLVGLFGYSAYSPSKFALRGLAESLRGELKPQGIKVAIVYPPDTDTPQLVAENQTKPVETRAITATAQTWTAENVAKTIIQGIEKSKFTITPGLEMTILNRCHSLISPWLQRYFDWLAHNKD